MDADGLMRLMQQYNVNATASLVEVVEVRAP